MHCFNSLCKISVLINTITHGIILSDDEPSNNLFILYLTSYSVERHGVRLFPLFILMVSVFKLHFISCCCLYLETEDKVRSIVMDFVYCNNDYCSELCVYKDNP